MRLRPISGLAARAAVLFWLTPAILAPSAAAAAVAADLIPEIEAALAAKGAPAGARILLSDPRQATPAAEQGGLEPSAVSYNLRSGRFVIRMKSAAGGAETVVTGVARTPVTAVALIGPVSRGEAISPDNVAMIETLDLAPGEELIDFAALEGTVARRALPAGAVLRSRDIDAPMLVRKGALVTISYERPGLRLAQQGVALAAGARGETIDVEIAGGRSLRAVVTAAGAAAVIGSRLAGLESR